MVETVSDYSEKKDNVYTDMVLTVEGREFHVCKSTLASFSDVCKNFGNWSDSKNPIPELQFVKAHQFQLALDFLYHKIDVTAENVEDLLEVATYLQIKTIVKECQKELCEVTSERREKLKLSRTKKLLLADKYVLPDLLNHVLKTASSWKKCLDMFPKETRALLSESTDQRISQKIKYYRSIQLRGHTTKKRGLEVQHLMFKEEFPDWKGELPNDMREMSKLHRRMQEEASWVRGRDIGYQDSSSDSEWDASDVEYDFEPRRAAARRNMGVLDGQEPPRVEHLEPEAPARRLPRAQAQNRAARPRPPPNMGVLDGQEPPRVENLEPEAPAQLPPRAQAQNRAARPRSPPNVGILDGPEPPRVQNLEPEAPARRLPRAQAQNRAARPRSPPNVGILDGQEPPRVQNLEPEAPAQRPPRAQNRN